MVNDPEADHEKHSTSRIKERSNFSRRSTLASLLGVAGGILLNSDSASAESATQQQECDRYIPLYQTEARSSIDAVPLSRNYRPIDHPAQYAILPIGSLEYDIPLYVSMTGELLHQGLGLDVESVSLRLYDKTTEKPV